MKPNTKIITLDDKALAFEHVGFYDTECALVTVEKTHEALFTINIGLDSIELYREDIPLLIKALQEFQKL